MSGSPETGPAKALYLAVRAALDERYPHWAINPQLLPDGLRVEMHPHVHYTIAADQDTHMWSRAPGDSFEELYARTFRVPVKITADMPDCCWRLVVVTEDVLAGGKMPETVRPTAMP